ncbi:Zn-dependent alcohol dehydrogenase [Novosphingopyxis sp.]|uniref:Zn-dependent alcohol dehydrogenase n=1 Tax=Novosphingopyxis sp. TaxID=2709690 RepID=UPI003B5C4FAE
MQAALLTEPQKPLEMVDAKLANPMPHEVLIRTVACGVCRSDLHFADGAFPHPLPTIPGHEAAGVVEKVGSEVTTVKPGDHVVSFFTVFCGSCDMCLSGHYTLCTSPAIRRAHDAPPRITLDGEPVTQFLNLSGYAEQMLVHENACVSIDRDMPLEKAALLGCAVLTGAGAVFRDCQLSPGETVAVIGCGGIGLSAINAAKIAGAGRIVAIDPVASKRDLALKIGATHAVDPTAEDAVKGLIKSTDGGFDYAIECVGQPATAEMAWSILKRGGTATILGMIAPGKSVSIPGPSFLTGKKLQGSLLGSCVAPIDLPRLVQFYLRGQLDLDLMVAEEIRLDGINGALDALRQGDSVRSVIRFD